jgi:prepilin-type N-terminal cleavage/methylation domain-containing protein
MTGVFKVIDPKESKKGFTLVELIVVIVILGILAAVITPAMIKWVAKTRTAAVKKVGQSFYEAIMIATAEDAGTGGEGMSYSSEDKTYFYEAVTNAKPAPTRSRSKLIYEAMQAENQNMSFAAICLYNKDKNIIEKIRVKDLTHSIVVEWTIEDPEWLTITDSDEAWTRPYTRVANDPGNVWWNGERYSESDLK